MFPCSVSVCLYMPITIQILLFNYGLRSDKVILRQLKKEDKRDQWVC